jgi:HlyD family secretion protein
MTRIITLLLLAAAVVGGVGFWYYRSNGTPPTRFRTAKVERGYLRAAIGATGTIEPEEVIDVGAQVAGRIDRFGTDPRSRDARNALLAVSGFPGAGYLLAGALAQANPVKTIDYSSPVEEGTVLAQLDPSLYQARVDSTTADLKRARAALGQMEAVARQTEREWNRVQSLATRKSVAGSDYDMARSNYETARANLEVGKAAILQAEAALKEAQTNLGYTTIRSPVKGVIIDRRVNVGQTVVAGLSAPSLFLIAKDLKRMQVWASVNEADIGQIKPGQLVYFTVDASPGQTFVGYVAPDNPRLNATMTNNVVTYTVVVNTDNSEGKLLPYLTGNLQFVLGERENALMVPNSALRWRPQPQQVVPEAREEFVKSLSQKRSQGSPLRDKGDKAEGPKERFGTVWVAAEEGLVRPVRVRIGLHNDTSTEILSGDLQENTEVIIGEAARGEGGGGANPFAPSLFRGKKKE